jgi:hypothetical protein
MPAKKERRDDLALSDASYLTLIELLKEAGASIRAAWELITNLLRNFFYLNFILFGIFVGSVSQLPQLLEKERPAAERTLQPSAAPPAGSTTKIELSTALEVKVRGASLSIPLVKAFSIIISGIGFLSALAACLILYRVSKHGRAFLRNARDIEQYLLDHLTEKTKISFYSIMQKEEEAEQPKKMTMNKLGYITFCLFGFGWFVVLLFAIGVEGVSVGISLR